ncbi:unnamed protein product [Parnassius apollo]|uniref:(apollo) hypothetical protein n=1 Tax=Parnassius apollo TaxID=110799 RepID=A0A8S3WE27_PARAO|nr:unnamed protein product [Parnassius apollo]
MTTVKLGIRVRPFTEKELKSEKDRVAVVCVNDEHTVTITNIKVNASGAGDSRERLRRYFADYTFNSACCVTHQHYASQERIFETIGQEVLTSMSQGVSACVLAYGQSATGKTYTMMGTESKPGLIPRLCRALGDENPSEIKVSYLEIYNERVHDLLAGEAVPTISTFSSLPRRKGNARKDLRVREHPSSGPYVQNLRRVSVRDVEALLSIVEEGTRRRRTATTRRNPESSRSHALLELCTPRGTLHLADLAGSEKASWEGCGGGRQKEGANINKSLVALSNVISALVTGGSGRSKFVPYRDSALTWLLKDCFTGGANIFIIATVSPSFACYGESASTLRWAAQARRLQAPKITSVTDVVSKCALKAQLNRLLSELEKHHIRYIPESGKITYDDRHWMLEAKDKSIEIGLSNTTTKIGNIMNNILHPKPEPVNLESTNLSVASGSLDVNNVIDKNTKIVNEITKEVDKLFGPTLERTRSGSVLEVMTPIKRQYGSQEVLPTGKPLHGGNIESFSNISQNVNEKDDDKGTIATISPMPIFYKNQRADIVASVTERLYSKFKKEDTVNKIDSMVEKKVMQPLSELKICTNARQRFTEISQKAMRNRKRLGVPAHTQTRKTVIRVKDRGIDVQTDLEPFIKQKDNMVVLYRDVSTETIPMTPRCKEVAVGDGYLSYHDKSTTMELKRIFKKSTSVMTDATSKRTTCTQTQVIPTPRRRKKSLMNSKLHYQTDNKQKCVENSLTSPIINIKISPMYSLDSDTLSSTESSEIGCVNENKSFKTPELFTNRIGTETSTGYQQRILEPPKEQNSEKHIKELPLSPEYPSKIYKDFSDDEAYPLPRVTTDSTNKVDSDDIKNMILGRNKNEYPYNVVLSPIKNKQRIERTIKFKDIKSKEVAKFNDMYSDNKDLKNEYSCKNDYSDVFSDDSDSSKLETASFVWNTKNLNKYDITPIHPGKSCTSLQNNKANFENDKTKDLLHMENDDTLDIDSHSSSTECYKSNRNIPIVKKYTTFSKCGNETDKSDCYECIENKMEQTCQKLEKVASRYEDYLANHCRDNQNAHIRSPTEYLQYLVQLRREVVKESLSTCSTGTILSD